jgi:hypothetical protein
VNRVRHRYCHLCGQAAGRYRLYERQGKDEIEPGLVVCEQCEATQARCEMCQVPMAPATAREGLCPVCRALTPAGGRCLACGQPVGRRYVTVGDAGPFCETCFRDRPRCDVCGAPVGAESWTLPDGRRICSRCHQTAVYQPEQASQLHARTVAIIQQDLGLALNVPTEFALVDRNELQELLEEGDADTGSSPEKTLGVFLRRGRRRGMYVQYGLPQILLIQVMAHEYAHAWQGENCPLLRDAQVKEGFAEWVAYKVLQELGASKKMAAMAARPDLYGEGLRHLLSVEQAEGIRGVLDHCRKAQ